MKEKRLMRAFGDIDEAFVAEAARPKKPIPWPRIVAAAAAVALTVGLALLPWDEITNHQMQNHVVSDSVIIGEDDLIEPDEFTTTGNMNTVTTDKCATETTGIAISTSDASTEGSYLVPKWDEMSITQQFTEVSWNDVTYSIASATIPADAIGEALGKVNAKGYDIYTDTTHETTVTLYRIRDIAAHCAVAVQYTGHTDYHPARHSWYRPQTLGQFLTDLNLKENIQFGKAHMDYFDEDMNYHTLNTQAAVAKEDIFSWLLADTTLENVYDQQNMYVAKMGISVSIPLLGYENISLAVTEEGYLTTNILDTGKAFFIGKDKVQAFIDHVTSTYPVDEEIRPADNDTTGTGDNTASFEGTVTQMTRITPGYDPSKQE